MVRNCFQLFSIVIIFLLIFGDFYYLKKKLKIMLKQFNKYFNIK